MNAVIALVVMILFFMWMAVIAWAIATIACWIWKLIKERRRNVPNKGWSDQDE